MFLTFIILFSQTFISSYIKLSFSTYKPFFPHFNSSDYFSIQTFLTNSIYSNLIIGSPPQKIIANLNFNDYAFNIYNNQCDIPSEYNCIIKNSTTRINKGYILTDVYVDTFLLEDIFSLPHEPYNCFKLNYIYAPLNNNIYEQNMDKKKYTCANIGLKLSVDYAGTLDYNFLRELKSLDIIENYVFYLYYNDTKNEEGELIIGKWPHEIDKDKFNFLNYREVYAINNKFILSWMFRFDKLFIEYIDNNKIIKYNLTEDLEAEIDYNLNVIYGTFNFMILIERIYFNKRTEKGICNKINLKDNSLIYYECEKSLDIKAFPEINFLHKTLSSEFILSYDDVFILENNKYIFLIWFDIAKNKNIWRLGKPFLKKYLFIFDLDKKTIGYYINKNKNSISSLEDENNASIKSTIIKLILLSIIAFVLCYIITKCYYQQKRKYLNKNKFTELIYMNYEAEK